jgi:uncharacterized protein with HEPN domain
MSEGRSAETGCADIVERNLTAIAELCRRFGVRRLDLFGSAATGRFDPGSSDLDFLVEFEPAAQVRAAERITRFTAGKSYDDYLDDDMLRAAVERQFEIIGEAFVGLRRVDPSLAAQLPDLRQIISPTLTLPRLRGREASGLHGYATINHQIVWDAIRDDLPGVLTALNEMLGTAPPP